MLRYLLEQNPDKRFRWEIDDAYRLRLPIDSLHKIRIVREVCVSIIDNFSWSIMAVEQEKLFCDIYRNKLNTWEISVPKELLDDYKNTDG